MGKDVLFTPRFSGNGTCQEPKHDTDWLHCDLHTQKDNCKNWITHDMNWVVKEVEASWKELNWRERQARDRTTTQKAFLKYLKSRSSAVKPSDLQDAMEQLRQTWSGKTRNAFKHL